MADASEAAFEKGAHDLVMCLGAAFIWDGLPGAVAALAPSIRTNGHLAIGEAFWKTPPDGISIPEGFNFASLESAIQMFSSQDIVYDRHLESTPEDWDRYVSLQWSSVERWLEENPGHPDAPGFRAQLSEEREAYRNWQRDLLGWAIFVGRKIEP